jgi:hypothetical protein
MGCVYVCPHGRKTAYYAYSESCRGIEVAGAHLILLLFRELVSAHENKPMIMLFCSFQCWIRCLRLNKALQGILSDCLSAYSPI